MIQPDSIQQMDAGTPVYDAEGRWIGIVSLRNVPGPQFVVQQGRLFPQDISLPVSAIARIDDTGISLHLSRVEVKQYAG